MKKLFQLLMVACAVALTGFLVVGCEPVYNKKLERNPSSDRSNTLYTYELDVKEYGLGVTEDGVDFIAIKYSFQNNGENENSFSTGITDSVFQNGVKLNKFGLLGENDETYIKSGASVDVVLYYELLDTTTDVEVVLKLGGSTIYLDEEEEAKSITRIIQIAE